MDSGQKFPRTFRRIVILTLALASVAVLPVVMWKTHDRGFLRADLPSLRLTKLPGGAVAQSLGAWILRDGLTPAVLATFLPLVLVAPAAWFLLRQKTDRIRRISVALTLGPVLIALGFACHQLIWWNTADGLLLMMLA